MATRRAFILAGTGSPDVAKPPLLGLLACSNSAVCGCNPCKVGPDYTDTAWRRHQRHRPQSRQRFMLPPDTQHAVYRTATASRHRGYRRWRRRPARQLLQQRERLSSSCPVILLVDGKAVSTSIAATVMGFQHLRSALDIAGVIVNRGQQRRALPAAEKAPLSATVGCQCSAMCRAWKAWRCPNDIWDW